MEQNTILLGGTVQDTVSWQAHLEMGEEALIQKLRKKLGTLKFMTKNMTMKGCRLLANGFIISRLIDLIPRWGGTEEKYKKRIQAVLNNTERYVTGAGCRVKASVLMD